MQMKLNQKPEIAFIAVSEYIIQMSAGKKKVDEYHKESIEAL